MIYCVIILPTCFIFMQNTFYKFFESGYKIYVCYTVGIAITRVGLGSEWSTHNKTIQFFKVTTKRKYLGHILSLIVKKSKVTLKNLNKILPQKKLYSPYWLPIRTMAYVAMLCL